tara:strand:+ start:1526 stop:2701 length:1176 start_codon:yes stop_codon:yes gene_type:complete
MGKITYNKQHIDTSDKKEVLKSLKNNLITTGPYVTKLEKKLCRYLKVKEVVTCSSGTSALYIAMRSINLSKGDIIIIPAINFIASVNMATFLGAKIFLCDVDEFTGQMTPEKLIECIKINKIKKIKAVITMYLGGSPQNVLEFYKLKKKYNFFLIEDSCHALGSSYKFKNRQIKIGSCLHSDISTFSLHPVKTITSGEGGFLSTNSKLLSRKFKLLRSHGIDRAKLSKRYWNYDVIFPSFNFRMSDLNASLAFSQVGKLNSFIQKRNSIANIYLNSFRDFQDRVKIYKSSLNLTSSYHLVIFSLNFKKLKINKDKFIKMLNKKNIFPQYHYIPIYKFSYYKFLKRGQQFKSSEKFYESSISMPIYYDLSIKELMKVIKSVKDILSKFKTND